VEAQAAKSGVPVVWVNAAGMASFARGVEELKRRLGVRGEAGAR
jgi:hypothetical protein